MAYIRILGIIGRVYVPQQTGDRKHNCKDCFICQMCSDSRCRQCVKRKSSKRCARKKPDAKHS